MNVFEAMGSLEAEAPAIADASIRIIEGLDAVSGVDEVLIDTSTPILSEELDRFEVRLRELMPNATEEEINAFMSGHLVGLFAGRGVEIDIEPVPTAEPDAHDIHGLGRFLE